jgi:membrane protease YdiL (CAAX protease family)
MLLCLGAVLCVELGTRAVASESLYSPIIPLGVARVLEAVLICLIVSTWGKGISSIGLAPRQMVGGFRRGLIWSAVFGMVASLGFVVLYAVDMNPFLLIKARLPQSPPEVVLYFAVGGLLAPVAEEVFFRGIMYGFLRRWGVPIALVGSTVIFVLAHSTGGRVPVTQIVGGIVFAIAYEVEGNLMVPITIHVLGNTAIFSLSLVA